jgi:hypothetical protein
MSQNPIVEDTKRKLSELEERIKAARSSEGAHKELADEAKKDWDSMVESHADISRKLNAADDHSAEALEGIRLDVDVLRNSFERWMARVESSYGKDK